MLKFILLVALLCGAPVARAATEAEVLDLSRIVYAEAVGEAPAGRRAVVHVVLNRVASPGFPKSIPKTLHQRNAFSCTRDGGSRLLRAAERKTLTATDAEWQAVVQDVRTALKEPCPKELAGACFYKEVTAPSNRTFDRLVLVERVGRHDFFR